MLESLPWDFSLASHFIHIPIALPLQFSRNRSIFCILKPLYSLDTSPKLALSFASVGVTPPEDLPLKLGLEPEVEDDYMETSSKILNIIYRYRLTKALGIHAKQNEGTRKFFTVIYNFVKVGKTVRMCFMAFPFKSANKTVKVMGSLPDKAEEISLDRLNTLCAAIDDLYKPGAKLLIISDGLV
jgi:hypothetical protein